MNQKEFEFQAQTFLDLLSERLQASKIQLQPHWSVDHLCYRTSTNENYLHHRQEFLKWGDLLIESEVNGRAIATFKLRNPISYQGRKISLVELPAPKPGKRTIDGFEHIEVVCDISFEKMKSDWSGCQFDESGLKKNLNPELEILMTGYAIKFHHLSLESVIRLEKNKKVYSAIQNSRVLEILRNFQPLIAGTFPLEIAAANSDVDILLTSSNLESLERVIRSSFGQCQDFSCCYSDRTEGTSLVVNFIYQGLPFELFAQEKDSLQQTAFLHFQVEERLLQLGGENLRAKIIQCRLKGFKTEPAFAEILGLLGDPYQALLGLHHRSDAELESLLLPDSSP